MLNSARRRSFFHCFLPIRRRLVKGPAVQLLFLLFVTSLLSCGTVRIYNGADQPVFYSEEQSVPAVEMGDALNVVTFNIKKAEKTELATLELQQLQKETSVDVFLLQEMDENGVKMIAGALGLNYLYIPVAYNTSYKKNVGNAILTKGAIGFPEKLLLPHAKPLSKSRRQVTIAEVTIRQKKMLVYSVHTETAVMSRKKRMDQVDAILNHVREQEPRYQYILIGGDFNTLFTKSSKLAVDRFAKKGFNWSTAGVGTTAQAFFGLVKPRHDYIFSKGLQVVKARKIETSRSSDHYPVLATFRY